MSIQEKLADVQIWNNIGWQKKKKANIDFRPIVPFLVYP